MGNVPLDAVTVEVVRAALNAAAERMRITMIKTAYNHIISEDDRPGDRAARVPGPPGLPHPGHPGRSGSRGLPRGRRLHPQRPLRGQRQPPERRGDVRAGVLGRCAHRVRLGEGPLERRGRPGAELHAGGLARVPAGGAPLPVGAPLRSRGAQRGSDADDPRQYPHRERHDEGHPGHDRGLPRRAGLLPGDPRQGAARAPS